MSDLIWGPLIYIFVDEKKIEKDKDLDQVNCEYTALFLNFQVLGLWRKRWNEGENKDNI